MVPGNNFEAVQAAVEKDWVTDFLTAQDRQDFFDNETEFMLTSVRYGEIADSDGKKDSAGNPIMHPVIYYGIVYTSDSGVEQRTLTMSDNDYRHIQSEKVAEQLAKDQTSVGPVILVKGPSNKRFNNPRWELAAPGSEAPTNTESSVPLDDIPFD